MCTTDYEAARVYRYNMQTARKEHKCSECRRIIYKREKYRYTLGIWDYPQAYKTCLHCLVGQEWLELNCGGFLHEGLEEEILEHAEDYQRFDLYRFYLGMRRKWKGLKLPVLKPLEVGHA